MLLENKRTIPLSQAGDLQIDLSGISPVLFDEETLIREREFFPGTSQALALMYKLFDAKGKFGKILIYPHTDRLTEKDDLLELYYLFLPKNTLGIYCTKDGGAAYALRDEMQDREESVHGEKPKVASTNTKFGDAQRIAEFLKQFAKGVRSNVNIDGPTDDEHLVVMTRPQVSTIASFGQAGDVIGVVLRPTVLENNRANHGAMELLIREKR